MMRGTDGGTHELYDVKKFPDEEVHRWGKQGEPMHDTMCASLHRFVHWFPDRFSVSSGEPLRIEWVIGFPIGSRTDRGDLFTSVR